MNFPNLISILVLRSPFQSNVRSEKNIVLAKVSRNQPIWAKNNLTKMKESGIFHNFITKPSFSFFEQQFTQHTWLKKDLYPFGITNVSIQVFDQMLIENLTLQVFYFRSTSITRWISWLKTIELSFPEFFFSLAWVNCNNFCFVLDRFQKLHSVWQKSLNLLLMIHFFVFVSLWKKMLTSTCYLHKQSP